MTYRSSVNCGCAHGYTEIQGRILLTLLTVGGILQVTPSRPTEHVRFV